MPARVKICGITNPDDALAAVDAGASALGFIFVSSSPRYIQPEKAREIIRTLPPSVTPVGVVAGVNVSDAAALAQRSGVRALQIHDTGGFSDYHNLPIPFYRVFHVSPDFSPEVLRNEESGIFMLDTFRKGMLGGTGRTFDWSIAVEAKKYGRLILSGGINPDNVAEALRVVAPYAIDLGSGVESSPGKKDHEKIGMLFDAIRNAEEKNDSR